MASDLTDLRCLTVRQPWASQLIGGSKAAEYRARPLPRTLGPLPVWVGIHAAARAPSDATHLPLGAVLGAVELVACERIAPFDPAAAGNPDPWRWPWAWVVGRRVALAEPLPARGALGLWRPDDDVRAALVAAIGAYGVPAKRGRRVECWSYRRRGGVMAWELVHKGRITSASGAYLYIDSLGPWHPTSGLVYLDDDGEIMHDTRDPRPSRAEDDR